MSILSIVVLLTCLGVSGAVAAPAHSNGDSKSTAAYAPEIGAEPEYDEAGRVAETFSTRHATFRRSDWSGLTGWREDELTEGWKAFRESCKVLARRSAWQSTCGRAPSVNASNDTIRRFVEHEFDLYQILNRDLSPAGVITGYYEPLLNGNLHYGGKYIYPIYGTPDDLLYLDSRAVAGVHDGDIVELRRQGRTLVRASTSGGRTEPGAGRYTIALGDLKPDIRDKRLRVRLQGNRILPFYTRAEIERGALSRAPAIAWVDSAIDLYIMQVQGSGKVRLPNGELLRVAYAEQNGHPFLPPVRARSRGADADDEEPLMRGIPVDLSGVDAETPDDSADGASATPGTRGMAAGPAAVPPAASDAAGRADASRSPEVARVIELLLIERERRKQDPKRAEGDPDGGASGQVRKPGSVRYARLRFSDDPSYVFFRKLPPSDGGPIGALGVALTPGRSVAVDPRTTPLGFPVYIAAEGGRSVPGIHRLMFAQDTGGAIRGAVRADYFWGFGAAAGERAGHMKQTGRMWLLVPKHLPLPEGSRGVTRGDSDSAEPDCVVPDAELCVE
jgi:membrane-bound lytic murein transglycosylase A